MTKPKILVTRRWPAAAEDYVREHYDATINMGERLTRDQLIAAMREYDGICPSGGDRMDAEVLGTPGARVKIIANFGVGFDHIDVAAAEAAGIVATNTPDVLSDATADVAILLMLMTSRRAYENLARLGGAASARAIARRQGAGAFRHGADRPVGGAKGPRRLRHEDRLPQPQPRGARDRARTRRDLLSQP
jgi:lactate dehydrogenase-like 2-hydroxyacid dehydrogenase